MSSFSPFSLSILANFVSLIFAFPNYAPISGSSSLNPCHDMVQDGKQYQLQPLSTFPYKISLDRTEAESGSDIWVTIEEDTFKGFLVLGRKYVQIPDPSAAPEGSFQLYFGDMQAKVVNCHEKRKSSSVTHTDNSFKPLANMQWRAPNKAGKYVILVTIAKQYQTFRDEIPSAVLTVTNTGNSE